MKARSDTHVVFGDLHPQDIALWCRLFPVAFEVARANRLDLKEIRPTPRPGNYGNQSVNGCCWSRFGVIEIVLRFKDDKGEWMPGPRPEADVWQTLAHELAHLEEDRHSPRFWALHENLLHDVNARRRY